MANTLKMAEFLKVTLNTPRKRCTSYTNLPRHYDDLEEEISTMFPDESVGQLRKFWIDFEGDKIDILNEKTYKIFLQMGNQIYLEEGTAPAAPAGSADPDPGATHQNISCDECQMSPIVGFRYKCVQCPDFDLCGKCEQEKKHKNHVMFRFPTPLQNIPFNRRFLKKMKKGCFIYPDSEEEAPPRRSSHGHGHRRYHNNIFSNLYTMMHDMAEGTEGPTEEDTDTAQAENNERDKDKKEGQHKKGKDERKPRRSCRREVVIDPSYLKTGVEILGNFSEMFGKILNPTTVTLEADAGESSGSSAQNTEGDASKEKNKVVPNSENKESTEKAKSPEKVTENVGNGEKLKESSTEGASALPSINKSIADQEKDELDWTLINPPSGRKDSASSNLSGGSQKTPKEADTTSKEESPIADYAKISKDLHDHLQRELMQSSPIQTNPIPNAPIEPEAKPETRAKVVFHKNQRINDAVHAMMSMGFSNDSNWLTYLLESVDGDICQALDLMKPAK